MRRAAYSFITRSVALLAVAAAVNFAHPSEHASVIVALVISVLFTRAVLQYRFGR